jgi:hypothetical protein
MSDQRRCFEDREVVWTIEVDSSEERSADEDAAVCSAPVLPISCAAEDGSVHGIYSAALILHCDYQNQILSSAQNNVSEISGE